MGTLFTIIGVLIPTALFFLALYYVILRAVRNGIVQANEKLKKDEQSEWLK